MKKNSFADILPKYYQSVECFIQKWNVENTKNVPTHKWIPIDATRSHAYGRPFDIWKLGILTMELSINFYIEKKWQQLKIENSDNRFDDRYPYLILFKTQ